MSDRSREQSSQAVSLHDVARFAGVGIATVSRAINGTGSVSPATRAKVMDAVARLGYRPNPVARAMRSDRSRIIALMVPDLVNEFYSVSADVIHRELASAGYQLIITTTESPEEEAETFRWLADYRVDGIIHVPVAPAQVLPKDIPVLQVNRVSQPATSPAVLADDAAGFAELTTTLLEYGHTDIVMITGEDWHSSTQHRLAGVRAAIEKRRGVRLRVKAGHYSRAWGYEATHMLAEDMPEAIIASSPRIASGVIEALRDMRVSVPEDVSLASYDDPEWFSLWQPGMTSVVPPLQEMAHRTVGRLMTMIDDPTNASDMIEHLPCQVRMRDSVRRR